MVVIWGLRLYGRIHRFAGSHIATRFFHIYWVPLIPLSSWLVLEEHEEGRFTGLQIPLQLSSIGLAWLRIASMLVAVAATAHVLSFGARQLSGSAFLALAAAALVFLAWFRLGRLSREQKAERVVYSDFTGRFVDVALLGEQRATVKQRASEELERHLAKHAIASYREAPQSSWREIACRPDQRDVPLLRAALTLSRVECAEANGATRREAERAHARIRHNLLTAAPDLLKGFELVA